jgi:deoxyribose-phosphate aldolase
MEKLSPRSQVKLKADKLKAAFSGEDIRKKIASFIDHTLLSPDATGDDIKKLCEEAKKFGFAAVCVNPSFVKLAAEQLRGSGVKVCTVIGFPLGATHKEVKSYEAAKAIEEGADEVDMVANVGALKEKNFRLVYEDVRGVIEASKDKVVKVILEMGSLEKDEKIAGCVLTKAAGASYVKTSTGFGKGGATVEDVTLIRKIMGTRMGIKAAGGIRNFETAYSLIKAGATRLGTSSGVGIVKESQKAA